MENTILDEGEIKRPNRRRRDLLPLWIKFFIWFFLIFGVLAIVMLFLSLLDFNSELAIYGLSTRQPFSLVGFFIIAIYIFKGFVAYSLWTEKEWAVRMALIDAASGFVLSVFMMFVYPILSVSPNVGINIRLELIPLAFYFKYMNKIRNEWEEMN